jgi:hypothetical protein
VKIVLGCDVDPVLPAVLERPPNEDIWACLDGLAEFVALRRLELPPITWLIRADESVRFATGDFASGYLTRRALWQTLQQNGHELGWHMHLASFDQGRRCFAFDPDPPWLTSAFQALSQYFAVTATRSGWDYANSLLFRKLDALGIQVDFSALPGNIVWPRVGRGKVRVDWLRSPREPYHPHRDDYQRPGALNLLEIPITQLPNSPVGIAKRFAWRMKNGSLSIAGLGNKTRLFTDHFAALPSASDALWSFYFHPEDLREDGAVNFLRNLDLLRSLPDVEFVTAMAARRFIEDEILSEPA